MSQSVDTYSVDLPADTSLALAIAARAFDVSVPDVVAKMVRRVCELERMPDGDPSMSVSIYCCYGGNTVEAEYLPATNAVTVLSGPLSQCRYSSPTAASAAVIASVRPVGNTSVSAWHGFWRIKETHAPLQAVRALRKGARKHARP